MLIHRRFEIGRGAHQLDRLHVVALDMGKNAGGSETLDLDLVRHTSPLPSKACL